ncbi:MAG: LemA family protein [Propionibacteriaceae bacterium]
MVPMSVGGTIAIMLLVIIAAAILGVLWLVGMYNGLVRQRNQVQESWNQVDVELQRRYDLIPNLVATVKGIAGHERNTLEEVVRLRNQAVALNKPGAMPTAERAQVEEQLSHAVSNLLVTVEAYPELKSSVNFMELQRSLTETEDRIAAGRRFFNANVSAYNTRVQSFPANVMAGMFGFTSASYFEVRDVETRARQNVDFNDISAVAPTQSQREAGAAETGYSIPQYQQAYPNSPTIVPAEVEAPFGTTNTPPAHD